MDIGLSYVLRSKICNLRQRLNQIKALGGKAGQMAAEAINDYADPAEFPESPSDDELRAIIYENFDDEKTTFTRLRTLFGRSK